LCEERTGRLSGTRPECPCPQARRAQRRLKALHVAVVTTGSSRRRGGNRGRRTRRGQAHPGRKIAHERPNMSCAGRHRGVPCVAARGALQVQRDGHPLNQANRDCGCITLGTLGWLRGLRRRSGHRRPPVCVTDERPESWTRIHRCEGETRSETFPSDTGRECGQWPGDFESGGAGHAVSRVPPRFNLRIVQPAGTKAPRLPSKRGPGLRLILASA
jgi:hypothetical protein